MKHAGAVRPGVIGKDGRTSAVIEAFRRSPRVRDVVRLSDGRPSAHDLEETIARARASAVDFVFVGPEAPLGDGYVDALQSKLGVPCVGPTQSLARLETSKAFTRELLARHRIAGNPEHRIFRDLAGLPAYLRELDGFVVKPDGLTGGKGVKVSGEHLQTVDEACAYASELRADGHAAVIIEEKLDGEEFSLQSFCDGEHVVDMVVVQDHKRAREGDVGPNTGGMGSYSCADHRLPFLEPGDLAAASAINAAVARALLAETGAPYRGVLYGGFILTARGVRLIEYNARLGDPEALNVLPLLRTDLVDVCEAIIGGTLDRLRVDFAPLATVCKYVVPEGYPDRPVKNVRLDLASVPASSDRLKVYAAAVDEREGALVMTGSRALGFVGLGESLEQAERIAEEAASAVQGPVYHRRDIGTAALIARRCDHIARLRAS
jgi:phosphoribosylamine--glycine ligase